MWNNNESSEASGKEWSELSGDEKAAAVVLKYTEASWDSTE